MKTFKYYYTYKITCTEGDFKDKVYYGQHKTNNLEDGYKGSGKKLEHYYKDYPNSYIFEILEFYDNLEDLCVAESELINTHFYDVNCLNVRNSGTTYVIPDEKYKEIGRKLSEKLKGRKLTDDWKRKIGEASKGHIVTKEMREAVSKAHKGMKMSDETRKKMSDAKRGKPKSDEHKRKLSESMKKLPKRVFVNKDGVLKLIFESTLSDYISDGWQRGIGDCRNRSKC